MVYFVVGPKIVSGQESTTKARLSNGVGSNGQAPKWLDLELEKFKLGNLDNMMLNYEIISKLEHQVEVIIKKIDKAYSDINPKNTLSKLKVESREHGAEDIDRYLTRFTWDDSKYPRNQALSELLKIMQQKASTVDNSLRHKIQAYNESKQAATNSMKKEGGSMLNRDLNDLFAENPVKKEHFVYTDYLTTLIAIVPDEQLKQWETGYEKLNEYVLPRSSLVLPITKTDIGRNKLCRFMCFKTCVEDVKQAARTDLKVYVREYEYNVEVIMERDAKKSKMGNQTAADEEALGSTCVESFKEIYATFAHIKVLKVVVDAQMRYGSSDDYLVSIVSVYKGKEKNIHKMLISAFAETNKRTMYGTKEELNDAEDFFPYAFAQISIP